MQTGPEGQQTITPQELVALTESLADTYVGSIANALNVIQSDEPSTEIRSYAQRVKVFVGLTGYSLATSPNPQIGLLDLVVNISVQRALFARGLASKELGNRAGPLLDAYATTEDQAWAMIGRVATKRQIDLLREAIQGWLSDHPNVETLPIVRLPALARYRNVTPLATPGGLSMLAPVAEAAKAAMELRLLGERSVYLAQRFPYIVNWQSELFVYNSLDTREARTMLDSTRIFASSADQMAGFLQKLPDSALFQQTVTELNGTLQASVPLLASMRGVITDLNQTLDDANRLLAPFQTPTAVGGGPPERTFDVGQYSNALRELGTSVRELNTLLVNARAFVTTPELGDRLGQVQSTAASGMGRLSEQGDHWIDRVFWRAVILILLFFSGLALYRAASLWMVRRFPPRTGQ
jgi:hypothetical protein